MDHNKLIGRDGKSEMELSCHLNHLGLDDDYGKGPTAKVYSFSMFIQISIELNLEVKDRDKFQIFIQTDEHF